MYLKFYDEDAVYTQVIFDQFKKSFSLSSSEGIFLECEKYLELDNEYNPQDYCFEIFYASALNRENDIFQVYDKQEDVRLGWIFPIQSLVSDSHDYADNIYFLKYAYVASYLLLNNIAEENKTNSSEFLKLTDFYPEGAVIFVMSKSNCNRIRQFCIWDYIADLFGYGYFCVPGFMDSEKNFHADKRINIRRISKDVTNKIFIEEVFKNLLVQTALLPLAKFHMLYQVIELLIGDIFSYEFIGFSQKIGQDTNNLFDMKDDLQKITGEKYRVKELFHHTYSNLDSVLKEKLMDACNEILKASDKKVKTDAGDSLYSVRCLVFHNYGTIPSEARNILADINLVFEKIVIELLATFHMPESEKGE